MMSIQSKHFLNTPDSLVISSLRGLCSINPQVTLDEQNKVVHLTSPDRTKVALVCGGGSGHEPAHAGFVGKGMLTAAVCGNIFASPNASQVRRGIELAENDKGTIIIVKNYTGDILNFGLAKEQYAALHPEKADRLRFVIVGEDVAVGKSQGQIVGRRGLAGTVLVYKLAGALADQGANLDQVYDMAQWVASRIVTIGVGLEHCHVPGSAASASYLSSSEIEIGMGIHNESGHKRISPLPPLSELVAQLLTYLTSTTDPERSFLPFANEKGKDSVVLLVNNLGGLSELELGGIVVEVVNALSDRGADVQRVLSGSFMTSLNMPGFSITLLLLPAADTPGPSTDLLLSLLDAKPDAPGWKWTSGLAPRSHTAEVPIKGAERQTDKATKLSASDPSMFISSVERACQAIIAAEPKITQMDNIAGDGDCGLTLKTGAEGVLAKIADQTIDGSDVVRSIIAIAQVAEVAMGGTSGALYSIFFSALAQGLQSFHATGVISVSSWAKALALALDKLYTYTRARPPSRTLVDPLAAFVQTLSIESGQNFKEAVVASSKAAEMTVELEAKAGRSAYVEGSRLKDQKVPDPGAWGVKVILESLLSV